MSTIANYITLSRFLLIPYIVQSMMYDCWMQAFCLFGLAAITDFLDGFFARQYNSESMLGKILDPLADKTLILSSFYAFSFQNKIAMIPFGMVVFLCIKDLFLILGSGLLFMIRGTIVSPSFIAKITTTLEMLLILYLASCRVFQSPASFLFLEVSLAILVLFSVYIFFDYVIKGIACLKKCLITLLFLTSIVIFCSGSVIKKRAKTPSRNKQKEEIVHQCEEALDLSLELISLLGHVCKQLARCIKEIIIQSSVLQSKDECEACQKRLEQYTKKVRDMVETSRSFSTSF